MAFRKAYILSGKNLHIVFQSGSLNGMDFECEFNPDGVSEILKDDDGNPILKDGKEQINPKSQVFEIVANEDYGRFCRTQLCIQRTEILLFSIIGILPNWAKLWYLLLPMSC